MALNGYLQQVQRILNDQTENLFNMFDLVSYINEARQQIAMESGCCRGVPQDLYTVTAQEIYPFSSVNVEPFPGVQGVFSVGTVAIVWGTFQYVVRRVSFGRYQAQVRNYTNAYQDLPGVACQVGDGLQGSIYLYPFPSGIYQMFWDSYFLPIDLQSDSDYEAIPVPWTNAVQYYAAYRALNTIYANKLDENSWSRAKLADRQFALYEKFMHRSRAMTQTNFVSNWYGRR
jgi:hypothetical protein